MNDQDNCPLCQQIRDRNLESIDDGLLFFYSPEGPENRGWLFALKRVTWARLRRAQKELCETDETTRDLWANEARTLIARYPTIDRYAVEFVAWRRVRSGYFLGQDHTSSWHNFLKQIPESRKHVWRQFTQRWAGHKRDIETCARMKADAASIWEPQPIQEKTA